MRADTACRTRCTTSWWSAARWPSGARSTTRSGPTRVDGLGDVAAQAGASLADAAAVRARRRSRRRTAGAPRRSSPHGPCSVIVDPTPGRPRPAGGRAAQAGRERAAQRADGGDGAARPGRRPSPTSCVRARRRRAAADLAGVGARVQRARLRRRRVGATWRRCTWSTRSTRTRSATAASAGSTDADAMASPLYRDTAVVLRTYKLGEADRIVVLLTEHHGKVRAVAKGVRKTTSKFGARLEPLSHVRLLLVPGPRARHRQPGRVGRDAGAARRSTSTT